jgi:hypothetical protein
MGAKFGVINRRMFIREAGIACRDEIRLSHFNMTEKTNNVTQRS